MHSCCGPQTERQLQLGDEEQIDERLARRAHELEGRLAKFGTAGIQKPKDVVCSLIHERQHAASARPDSAEPSQLSRDVSVCECFWSHLVVPNRRVSRVSKLVVSST